MYINIACNRLKKFDMKLKIRDRVTLEPNDQISSSLRKVKGREGTRMSENPSFITSERKISSAQIGTFWVS